MSFNILVVDDTKFMRKMLTDILKQYGHEVVGEAENGRQAVQRYEELRPDVVLMDITMPEMDGIDAMKEIRRIDADAVVLICSAMSQQDLISDALKAGANGYVMKPFKPNRVNEIVRKYGFRRATSQAAMPEVEPLVVEELRELVQEPEPLVVEETLELVQEPEPLLVEEPLELVQEAEPLVVEEPLELVQEAEPLLVEESLELVQEAEPLLVEETLELVQELEPLVVEETLELVQELEPLLVEESLELVQELEPLLVEESLELVQEPELQLVEETLELVQEPEPLLVEESLELVQELEPLVVEETLELVQELEPLVVEESLELVQESEPLVVEKTLTELVPSEMNETTLPLTILDRPAARSDSDEVGAGAGQPAESELELSLEQLNDITLEMAQHVPEPMIETDQSAVSSNKSQELVESGKRGFKAVDGGKIINLFRGNEPMKNFTSSYMCNWNEEVSGEMSQFLVICTESENKIAIEMTVSGNQKQTINLSIDGFNQLGAWLQDKLGNAPMNMRELAKKAD